MEILSNTAIDPLDFLATCSIADKATPGFSLIDHDDDVDMDIRIEFEKLQTHLSNLWYVMILCQLHLIKLSFFMTCSCKRHMNLMNTTFHSVRN